MSPSSILDKRKSKSDKYYIKINNEIDSTNFKRKTNKIQEKQQRVLFDTNINRINTFKLNVGKGPYYFCVICNRGLYRCSVRVFDESKYSEMPNRDCSIRVLKCNLKILKKKIPCQAVFNTLQIDNLPNCFSDIRRLEK